MKIEQNLPHIEKLSRLDQRLVLISFAQFSTLNRMIEIIAI